MTEKIYMLHGFMGTGELHFSDQIEYFNQTYHVEAIDLPGHGTNDHHHLDNKEYFEYVVEWFTEYINTHGSGYILGLSLGASIAIHTALRQPFLVNGIILTGYSPYITESLEEVMNKQYEYFMNIKEHDREIASYFEEIHGDQWFTTLERVLHTMTYNYPSVSEEKIKSLSVPTLLINGSNEQHEISATSYMHKCNPDMEVGLLPGAGHTANMDKPWLYNQIVKEFMENI
ncbi:alpha/beta fold hydrolase [Pontibacillus yanchengensis]|uniref:Alpha/beta hydrolase n=1 Tax=Pontibacillus yanchengensis Y32 TaxID=1385514 RepID=A0A0A2TG67_9BACI|nr:alpha/beta fold hydrolase [Pontibacillus yanchengensis]KGP73418.1 alpha/beta hydrolase [Pontibacillus yanchengensis Y32]